MVSQILGVTRSELHQRILALGGGIDRARAIYNGIYRAGAVSIPEIPDVNRDLLQTLGSEFKMDRLEPIRFPSADGSTRFLFKDKPDGSFEAVSIPIQGRSTVCISSQVGCALDCKFCVTGLLPLKRNLQAWEMVDQVLAAQRANPTQAVTNVVFMGMGEPLLNYDEVKRAVEILSDHHGMGIPRRKITVSTAGYLPNLLRFGKEVRTNLAVSLIAATNEKRSRWMPINVRFPLPELMETLRQYIAETNRRVFLEYILMRDETDTDADLEALTQLLQGMRVTVNLIPYNENESFPIRRSTPQRIEFFRRELQRRDVFATVRWSYGGDVSAACGQLAGNAI